MNYDEFIASKTKQRQASGFEPLPIKASLFDWQKSVVRWAVRSGRAALFEECGLGKTLQQLEWSRQVAHHTKSPVLILTPLAVAHQTQTEAAKFGIKAKVVSSQAEVTGKGVWITNYEKLEHFEPSAFSGVVLDESSILKAFTGKTRIALTQAFAKTPYRLCCTATPSPNDYTEFGQHADFLGVCSPAQMLATFFVNDTFNTGDWRLKKHAEGKFWEWVASWACCVSKPSDIGFKDDGYDLPPLHMHTETVDVDETIDAGEELFRHSTLSATTIHREMRMTSDARAARVAAIVASKPGEQWLVWCNTNDEADKLAEVMPEAVEIRGSDSEEKKEAAIDWFLGNLCICHHKNFRAESATWQQLKNTSKNTTVKIEFANSPKEPSITKPIKPFATRITESITRRTNTSGLGEAPRSRQNTTELGASDTKQTRCIETRLNQKLKNGLTPTREEKSDSASENTVLPSSNLTPCEMGNAMSALSAGLNQTDSTSTIATLGDKCADSSATTATSGSENSETQSKHLNEQSCICGHTSGRRWLISKCSMFGHGLNLQNCAHVAFVGLSYSFEDFYQSLRRTYRFGQKREVHAHVIQAKTEGAILQTIQRKIEQHKTMQQEMKRASAVFAENRIKELTMNTEIAITEGADFRMAHADCVRFAKTIPNNSIDFSVFSPPFADLFTYSDDLQDMGNCSDVSEFTKHFEILIEELARVMVPGREVAVHCCDLLSTKWKSGKIQFQDFSGEIIRAFWRHNFLFHSRICIWKSPVTEMQRTKAHGLLYKTLKADSCDSRVGCADYLLVFRKPGENPRPVVKDPSQFPVDLWQEVASPVWMTVDQGRVLNGESGREHNDERHICPLQLDVIERACVLWSNPGDLVYSPFAGIGSEGYGALRLGRKFIGSELKRSYYELACSNLANATKQTEFLLTA